MKKSRLSILNEDPEIAALLQQKQMASIMDNLPKSGDLGPFLVGLKSVFQGEAGTTPVKGKDYFTDKEIAEFKKAASPEKFKDYFTDQEIEWLMRELFQAVMKEITDNLKAELTPRKGIDYQDGINGQDADEVDIPALVATVIQSMPKQKEVNEEAIVRKTVTQLISKIPTIDEFVKEIKEKKLLELRDIKGARLDTPSKKASESFNMNDQRWHGAGGTTSGGASVTTQYLLTATQDGSDVLIDLSQLAHFATFQSILVLYRNNIPQTSGALYNFTLTGSTVRVFNADAAEIFNITYAY